MNSDKVDKAYMFIRGLIHREKKRFEKIMLLYIYP